LRLLVDLDIDKSATVWKHPRVEEFLDNAWENGPLKGGNVEYPPTQSKWQQLAHKSIHCFRRCLYQPR
jgi:hypothetical protein